MKYQLSTLVFILISILVVSCQLKDKDQGLINYEEFKNPSKEYRPALFYSLNDSLHPELIRKQVSEFAKGGIGGIFFHAREGLLTQYWGKEWWDAIDAGVDQCIKSGINPWFYDDYKWPSGYAGGYVPRKSEEYRGHFLARISIKDSIPANGIVINSDKQYNYVCMTATLGNPWLNGTCKIDYLNPDAIHAFIEHTYRTYANRNKQKYNNMVKGIFFDEPDIHPETNGHRYNGVISYSPAFRETFRQIKGYDIAEHFASLFEEKGNFRKIRLDFWQIAGLQYEKAFVKQLGTFCKENNLLLTGHFFPEETLEGCKTGIGNLMRQLRNEDIPGMDHLELRIAGGLNVAKSVSSVGNQYGKERCMSELFGVSGQNMSFEDQKWIANWHAVLGINFFVEHLALYSMRGERKRDFPPALSFQQPWWEQGKYIQDYLGRLCYLTTIGKYAAKTLLMVPIESMYIAIDTEKKKLENDYYTALENLMKIHCDFDLGDEQIIEEIGKVDKKKLIIGNMDYSTIIIPELLTLRTNSVQKLLEFVGQGGKLVVLGNYPQFIDAEKNNKLLNKFKQLSILIPNETESLKEQMETLSVNQSEQAEIYTQKRTTTNGNMYVFTNISRLKTESLMYTLKEDEKNPVIWDLANAKTYIAVPDSNRNVKLKLDPATLLILTTGDLSNTADTSKTYHPLEELQPIINIESDWTGHKLSPNAMTLDFANYAVGNAKMSAQPEPIIAIMKRMAEKGEEVPLQLQFDINIQDVPDTCALVLENPQMYNSITINNSSISSFPNTYYQDVFFRKSANIASLLKKGKNVISLTLDFIPPVPNDTVFAYRYGTELENIYLIGDFAVLSNISQTNQWNTEKNNTNMFVKKPVHRLNEFVITKEPTQFQGDIVPEGYPFFAGKFRFSNSFFLSEKEKHKSYYIHIPLSEAIVYELTINGYQLPPCMSSPYTWDITDYVVTGHNSIDFTLTNSLRNLLGPHHHKGGELKGMSPLSFVGSGGWPHGQGDRNWYDLRLNPKNELRIWTDDYQQIPFGFIKPVQVCTAAN